MASLHHLYRVLILVLPFASFSLGASSDCTVVKKNSQYTGQIFNIQHEEKIYLSPDRIIASENGIFFLDAEENAFQLEALLADEAGFFTVREAFDPAYGIVFVRKTCEECDYKYIVSIFNKGKCPNCGHVPEK